MHSRSCCWQNSLLLHATHLVNGRVGIGGPGRILIKGPLVETPLVVSHTFDECLHLSPDALTLRGLDWQHIILDLQEGGAVSVQANLRDTA